MYIIFSVTKKINNANLLFDLLFFLNSGLRHVKLDCYSLVTNELLIALRSESTFVVGLLF